MMRNILKTGMFLSLCMLFAISIVRADGQSDDIMIVESKDATDDVIIQKKSAVLDNEMPKDTLWALANMAYSNGNYKQAIGYYDELLSNQVHSAKLYYNLGNSWFKQGRMGKAILNYNRSLLLDPSDEDTQYNLALANVRIVDKIDSVPEFIIKTWLRDLGLALSSNSWAVIGLVCLGLTFVAVILWLLSNTMSLRKLGFYGGLTSLVVFLVATSYANFQRERMLNGTEAVVMNLVAPVKSSPGAGSKDIFVLNEGTKVKMLEQISGWTEIVLSDGNKGWIATNAIEAVVMVDVMSEDIADDSVESAD